MREENRVGSTFDLPPKYEDINDPHNNDSFSNMENNDVPHYPPENPPPYSEAIAGEDQQQIRK